MHLNLARTSEENSAFSPGKEKANFSPSTCVSCGFSTNTLWIPVPIPGAQSPQNRPISLQSSTLFHHKRAVSTLTRHHPAERNNEQ